MKLATVQASAIKSTFEVLKDILNDVNIYFKKDGVYIVTVCIRAHYMLVWGCSRVASGPFCACAAATATAVLFWWSVWLWSCCGVLGGRPLRWLVFRNTQLCWFVAEVTASTTMTHRAAVQERGNTDRTKDKENFLPRRDSRPSGACRASQKAY